MEEKNYTGIVPENYTGKQIDTQQVIELPDSAAAKNFFTVVKSRLLDVNNWIELTGEAFANFQLVDSTGKEVSRPVQQGDYFKINIPGPGSQTGDGFDWVQVEQVEEVATEDVESVGIRVRPTSNPLNNHTDIAHFYSEESTSNFIVTRENNKITASIYDRNTKPNKDAEALTDKIRDIAVGSTGVAALSKIQWQTLAEAFLKGHS